MDLPRTSLPATAPETLEGWYALHQIFSIDRQLVTGVRQTLTAQTDVDARHDRSGVGSTHAASETSRDGWTAYVHLIGSRGDLLVVHFRSTLDAIGEAERTFMRQPRASVLIPVYSFLSVTEAGLYHLSADLARAALERGGAVGDDVYKAELAGRSTAERESPHVQRRLYPQIPEGMPYVCFYPMSKRRAVGQNWYALPLDERSRLMHTHGMTGRRYAGRVVQIITGAIGFDVWEWGVTLFAKDPLDFKKLVTDMRFDEVSANYADFGEFFVGTLGPNDLDSAVETIVNGRA
jgi:hydrogen peroxide-dependent heme synthase